MSRELEDPRPVIASLFGSNTTTSLSTTVLALYVHNGVKIYASWLSSLASNWEEPHLAQIISVTSALEARLADCASSNDIELQERAAELGQLLALVRKGLDAPRPIAENDPTSSEGFGDGSEGFPQAPSTSALPPSSLSLLSPAFFSHELNPVNTKAQRMVAVPQGLDLDLVIIPRTARKEEMNLSEEEDVDDFGRPRVAKGKAREEVVEYDGAVRRKKPKGLAKKGKGKKAIEDPEEVARVSFRSA